MIKMIIKMDKDKIESNGQYSIDSINEKSDGIFLRHGLNRFESGDDVEYRGSGKSTDFGNFTIILNGLRKQSWFMDNATRWIQCNSDDSDDPNDFSEEDLLEYFGYGKVSRVGDGHQSCNKVSVCFKCGYKITRLDF